MNKLSEQELFDKAWEEKRQALAAQTTASFRKRFPATAAQAARLLALMEDLREWTFASVRDTEAFRQAMADYETTRVESAAVMRLLGLVEQYVLPLVTGTWRT